MYRPKLNFTAVKFAVALVCTSAHAQVTVQTLSHPISVNETNGGKCRGGFIPNAKHFYFDAELDGYHAGDDTNGYTSSMSSCDDEGTPVRAIGHGKVVVAENQGTGRGNVVITRHVLPDDLQNEIDFACFHLKSIAVTKGQQVITGTRIGELGKSGTLSPHLHCEATLVRADTSRINPWHDICLSADAVQSHCVDNANGVRRPRLTASNAARYISPKLLVESRAYGQSLNTTGTVSALNTFTVGAKAPGSLAVVSVNQRRMSINAAKLAGFIMYGLVWQESDGRWLYTSDSRTVMMVPGKLYAIIPLVSGVGISVSYPVESGSSKEDLALHDAIKAASRAGLSYIETDALVRNPAFARDTPDFITFGMRATRTTNTTRGSTDFAHWVVVAQHRERMWTSRQTNVWNADTRTWSGWTDAGDSVP